MTNKKTFFLISIFIFSSFVFSYEQVIVKKIEFPSILDYLFVDNLISNNLTVYNFTTVNNYNITGSGDFYGEVNFYDNISLNNNEINDVLKIHFNISNCNSGDEFAGTVCWNSDEDTLDVYSANGQRIQVGRELGERGYNDEGSTVNDGKVVYLSGVIGDNPKFKLADSSNVSKSSLVGVVTTDCNAAEICPITVFGFVNDVDTSAWSAGDKLYINPDEPGNLTNVLPTLPNNPVWVATVVRVSSTVGRIFVNPSIDPSDGFLINNIWATADVNVIGSVITDSVKSMSSNIVFNTMVGDENGTSIPSGVIGYWSFTGDTTDGSGGGNTLSVFGGSILTADKNSVANQAYYFSSSGDYLKGTGYAVSDWSISSWFAVNGNLYEAIAGFTGSGGQRQEIFLNSANGRVAIAYYNSGQKYRIASSGTDLRDGTWHHVSVSYTSSTNSLTVYLDGNPLSFGAELSGGVGLSSVTYICEFTIGSQGQCSGTIDQVYFWDRVLTSEEHATMYSSYDNFGGGTYYKLGVNEPSPSGTLHITNKDDIPVLVLEQSINQSEDFIEWSDSDSNVFGVLDYRGFLGLGSENPTCELYVDGDAVITGNLDVSTNASVLGRFTTNSSGYIKDFEEYLPSLFINNSGTNTSSLDNVYECMDNEWFNLTETTGAPGFDYDFRFTNIDSFKWIQACIFYEGSTTHNVRISVYNQNLSSDVNIRQINTGAYMNCNYWAVDDDTDIINGNGNVTISVIHDTAGNPAHDLHIGCLKLLR